MIYAIEQCRSKGDYQEMPEGAQRVLLVVGIIAMIGLLWLVIGSPLMGSERPIYSSGALPQVAAVIRPVLSILSVPTPTAHLTPVPTPADPRGERYFPQTGFRIDNDTIWDYFSHRGGVGTFGYPISRPFPLSGFVVQMFQRRIIQLDKSGHARLLNVLDPSLLPYTHFGGREFPGFDPESVATAPDPTDIPAILAWVRMHAPDTFQGKSVHFYQTFVDTVPSSEAFVGPGDSHLLVGFALEMWGIPTSSPWVDPHNGDIVYLRWQRGIMQFDATCGCTQAVLLAEQLKRVLTGVGLTADLDQEAQTSPLYRQYDPSRPRGLRRPELLPGTDLTSAFTSQ